MRDTIEMLEAIGRDASLRHSSPKSLAESLSASDAPEELVIAAASGDAMYLARKLGLPHMQTVQSSQAMPGHEEHEKEDEESEEGDDSKENPSSLASMS